MRQARHAQSGDEDGRRVGHFLGAQPGQAAGHADPQNAMAILKRGHHRARRQTVRRGEVPDPAGRRIDPVESVAPPGIDVSSGVSGEDLDVVARQALRGRECHKRRPRPVRMVHAHQPAAEGREPEPAGAVTVDVGDGACRQPVALGEGRKASPGRADQPAGQPDPHVAGRVFSEGQRQVVRTTAQPRPRVTDPPFARSHTASPLVSDAVVGIRHHRASLEEAVDLCRRQPVLQV